MCDCIDKIDADLREQGQSVNATMFGERKALVSLIRDDKHEIENRRSKPRYVLATFCPFCGERYAQPLTKPAA